MAARGWGHSAGGFFSGIFGNCCITLVYRDDGWRLGDKVSFICSDFGFE